MNPDTIPGYLPPPFTGAQKCVWVGEWIIGAQSFYIGNEGPICPREYKKLTEEVETLRDWREPNTPGAPLLD